MQYPAPIPFSAYLPLIGISSLLSHRYLPRMYIDNRFLNMVIAAESLERIRLQEQDFKLSKALETLASTGGTTFATLVVDVDGWIKEVVRTRVANVVHRGLQEEREPEFYLLSESLYFLVVLCLLKECGVADKALSEIQRNPRFVWLNKEIKSLEIAGPQ